MLEGIALPLIGRNKVVKKRFHTKHNNEEEEEDVKREKNKEKETLKKDNIA